MLRLPAEKRAHGTGQRGGVREGGDRGEPRAPGHGGEQHGQRGEDAEGGALGGEGEAREAHRGDKGEEEGDRARPRRAGDVRQRRHDRESLCRHPGPVGDLEGRGKDEHGRPDEGRRADRRPGAPLRTAHGHGQHGGDDHENERCRGGVRRPGEAVGRDRLARRRGGAGPHAPHPGHRAQQSDDDRRQRPHHRHRLHGAGSKGEAAPHRLGEPGAYGRQQGHSADQIPRDRPVGRQRRARDATERGDREQAAGRGGPDGDVRVRQPPRRRQRDRPGEEKERRRTGGGARAGGRPGQPAGREGAPAAQAVRAHGGDETYGPHGNPERDGRVERRRHQQRGRHGGGARVGRGRPEDQRELCGGQRGRQGQAQREPREGGRFTGRSARPAECEPVRRPQSRQQGRRDGRVPQAVRVGERDLVQRVHVQDRQRETQPRHGLRG